MEWKTKISKFTKDESIIRGEDANSLIGNKSFSEVAFLVLRGEMPTENEAKMLDAIFVSSIDHGIEAPSTTVARTVSSCGNEFHSSVASGINTLGDFHGGAVENCAFFLQKEDIESESKKYIENKKPIPGFGHKLYKDEDPRVKVLVAKAKELGVYSKNTENLIKIEKVIEEQKGKKIPINIDGIIASLILDLGFDSRLAKAFFIIPRTVGLCAHVYEETTEEKPVRRIDNGEYVGEKR